MEKVLELEEEANRSHDASANLPNKLSLSLLSLPGGKFKFARPHCACAQHLTRPSTSVINQPVSEIRNRIYTHVLSGVDAAKLVRSSPSGPRDSFLPMSQACKQLHDEFLSWFQEHTTISVELAELNSYLRTFHPNNKPCVKNHPVKLCLLLPKNEPRPCRNAPYTDLTRLHTLRSQCTNFTVQVAQPSALRNVIVAGTVTRLPREAAALEQALRRLASAPLPVAEGILAVRLIMMPARSHAHPVLWLVVKQHTVLPGEWPWYGAVDLHGESAALWQTWLSKNSLEKVEGWDIYVTVTQSREEVPWCMWLSRGEEEYQAVPEKEALEKALKEKEKEGEDREWDLETLGLSSGLAGGWDWDERARRARAAKAEQVVRAQRVRSARQVRHE